MALSNPQHNFSDTENSSQNVEDILLIDDTIICSKLADRILDSLTSQLKKFSSNASVVCDDLPVPAGMMASSVSIPSSLQEALQDPEFGKHWRSGAHKEMHSMCSMHTCFLAALPYGRKAIIFKVKAKGNGMIEKFKARLVVKRFSRPGVDYDKTFAPVAHSDSQRILLATATNRKLRPRQADILNASLCGEIDFELFMKQPEGYVDQDHPEFVCKLQKGLYGLKQAGYLFNRKLEIFLREKIRI